MIVLTVHPTHDGAVCHWERWSRNSAGQLLGRPTRTVVHVALADAATEADLMALAARMVRYVTLKARGVNQGQRVTKWRVDAGPWTLVPPEGGKGGDEVRESKTDRSADTAQVKTPLPSDTQPRGAGEGGERSDLVSAVDLPPEELPGQLAFPL